MTTTFKCEGNVYDSIEEAMEDGYDEGEAVEAVLTETCDAELEVPGRTGMAHIGVTASDFWCDECGRHYTASQAKAKYRKQKREEES